jgi:alkylation response protein AidB-like acyl-CoA dehydrogenase
MDFNYTPEQEAYRMEVRGWLEANQPPPLKPEEKERADENFLWERLKLWHKKLYDGGWAGLTWPKQFGGRGATFVEQVIFQQELGRLNLPMGCNVLGVIMTGPALMQWGTEEQKQRYLQKILSAEEIWSEGMSEPAASPRCRPAPCSTATTLSSTGRRSGPRTPIARTSASSLCAPTPTFRGTRD